MEIPAEEDDHSNFKVPLIKGDLGGSGLLESRLDWI